MIYFDNSSTTLKKPPEVARAVAYAIDNFGNAGRSFHLPALEASREIYKTREQIAKLVGLSDPLSVAFTSSATESLNLVIGSLVKQRNNVASTVLEHNSVLRPLYASGCDLSIVDSDDYGNLRIDTLEAIIKPSTKIFVCTHGSNLSGNITDVREVYRFCKSRGITLILDISQTLGSIPVDIDMADIFCFTGHKSLFGPQGTGGVITNGTFDFSPVKSGGSGQMSHLTYQPTTMPDIFESGTQNTHGLYGLQQGVRFVHDTGLDKIQAHCASLWKMFYTGLKSNEKIEFYGDYLANSRLPIVSLNIKKMTSSELSERLWLDYNIATRPGNHCAPLLHKRFGTHERGSVRFSFSYFNTEAEVSAAVLAMHEISAKLTL